MATLSEPVVPVQDVEGGTPLSARAPSEIGSDTTSGERSLKGEDDPSRSVAYLDALAAPSSAKQLAWAALAEMVGTAFLVIFTTGAVVNATATAAGTSSLTEINLLSGLGLVLGILLAGPRSGAHLNPAISLAVAINRPTSLPWFKLPIYWAAQLAGGVAGGGLVYGAWQVPIRTFERVQGIVRGTDASAISAGSFTCYFPAPGAISPNTNQWVNETVSHVTAFLCEAIGTAILACVVAGVLDRRVAKHIDKESVIRALVIGLTLFMVETLLGPLTTGCFNPARDFGPRLVTLFAGWGRVAIPGPRTGFWIYIVAPLVGGPIGMAFYDHILSRM